MNIFVEPWFSEQEAHTMITDKGNIKEGLAVMHFPFEKDVFFNPVQEFNRDISICVIKSFIKYKKICSTPVSSKEKKNKKQRESCAHHQNHTSTYLSSLDIISKKEGSITILEALAATGIRGIRYALEIEDAHKVIINDIQPHATKTISLNSVLNKVTDRIIVTKMDASTLFTLASYPTNLRPDVIDIDPYGSASIFLDSALKCVADGGLLCITCTDMSCLCGNYPETCYSKYGSVAIRTPFCHEMGIRILLNCINSIAARYKRYIVPLISLSVDFYIRVFVQVFTSSEIVKTSLLKSSLFSVCTICGTYKLFPIGKQTKKSVYTASNVSFGESSCSVCSGPVKIAGPVWSPPIHTSSFIEICLQEISENAAKYGTCRRIEGVLNVIHEELLDIPFYYIIDNIFSVIRSSVPSSLAFRSAINSLGYRISHTHCKKNGFKTDAPIEVIWDVVKAWFLKSSANTSKTMSPYGKVILSAESAINIDFTPDNAVEPLSKVKKMRRFQQNPFPNWGPMKKGQIKYIKDDTSNLK